MVTAINAVQGTEKNKFTLITAGTEHPTITIDNVQHAEYATYASKFAGTE
jgi:hypothetical protein